MVNGRTWGEKRNGCGMRCNGHLHYNQRVNVEYLSCRFIICHLYRAVWSSLKHRRSDICDLNVEEPIMNGNNDVRVISHVQLMRKKHKNTTFTIMPTIEYLLLRILLRYSHIFSLSICVFVWVCFPFPFERLLVSPSPSLVWSVLLSYFLALARSFVRSLVDVAFCHLFVFGLHLHFLSCRLNLRFRFSSDAQLMHSQCERNTSFQIQAFKTNIAYNIWLPVGRDYFLFAKNLLLYFSLCR